MHVAAPATPRTARRVVAAMVLASLVAALVAAPALAGKPGSGGTTGCVRATPGVAVQNTWTWAATGSYGLAGQRLAYQLSVTNYDTGCGASTFSVALAAPSGFAVSMSTTSLSLKSSASALLTAYVTAPAGTLDGDYPVTASVVRSGTTSPAGTALSYFKVYSTDSTAPTLYWPSPADGQAISGRSAWIQVSATDDHMVKSISLAIDGVAKATVAGDGIAYTQSLAYSWSTVKGAHTATFTAVDWMGNASSLTVAFTVG